MKTDASRQSRGERAAGIDAPSMTREARTRFKARADAAASKSEAAGRLHRFAAERRDPESRANETPRSPGVYRVRTARKAVARQTPLPEESAEEVAAPDDWLSRTPALRERFEVLSRPAHATAVAFVTERTSRRRFALKICSVANAANWDEWERLAAEAKTLRSLRHKAIPRYAEHGEIDGSLYLLTHRIPGSSVQARMDRGDRWSDAKLRHILAEAVAALAYLHDLNPPVFHGGIQPEHILVSDRGDVGLVSFGDARSLVSSQSPAVGRRGYARDEPAGAQADLYALGATVAALAAGADASTLPTREDVIDLERCIQPGPIRDTVAGLLGQSDERRTAAQWARALRQRG